MLTMTVRPAHLAALTREADPTGDRRRAGWSLDPNAIPVVTSPDQWSFRTPTLAFRIWDGRLYRKDIHDAYYGGYQVRYVALANTRLVNEWLNGDIWGW